jgi:hypothetical protein
MKQINPISFYQNMSFFTRMTDNNKAMSPINKNEGGFSPSLHYNYLNKPQLEGVTDLKWVGLNGILIGQGCCQLLSCFIVRKRALSLVKFCITINKKTEEAVMSFTCYSR